MSPGLEISLALPDLWQQEAVRALVDGRDVIIDAPTSAGKTHVFELFAKPEARNVKGQAVFTVPTRALANDKFREWSKLGWDVGIATGDLAENLRAPVIVATLETQRERLLSGSPPAMMAVDEYQMIADEERGLNYELAIALAPPTTQLLLLSGSVANPEQIADWLTRLGRAPHLIREKDRPVPLEQIPVEVLPGRPPSHLKGLWPRIAAQTLVANLGPLLIFAPRRAEAEKIARKIAAALPVNDPLSLPADFPVPIGKDLEKLLASRVAYHHSGLSYAARAGVIEPLAKAGQLRVIVATMGLAAGINFSVRSVLVADTAYSRGPFEMEVRPDELLQMFGRAGRRGMDECGHVLTTRKSPSLSDAAPRPLRRVNEVDWPTLLRVMDAAAGDETPPFEAARRLCENLFSRQTIHLGIENESPAGTGGSEEPLSPFATGPVRPEILNASGQWENARGAKEESAPLEACLARHRDRWRPALKCPDVVLPLGPGSLCRLPRDRSFVYGKQMPVARVLPDGTVEFLPALRKRLRMRRRPPLARAEAETFLRGKAAELGGGGRIVEFARAGDTIRALLDFSEAAATATRDSDGNLLLSPPKRTAAVEVRTHYKDTASGREFDPAPGSAAHAWRKLGLVDARGTPTRRGRVFSFFQKGEGLIVAAALEDESYPVEEIAWHLANLRGGYRFTSDEGLGSERLAAAARRVHGMADHPGYLRLGLPPAYGEGTAEVVGEFLENRTRRNRLRNELLSAGDIERAAVEWLSLLRHVAHAPDLPWNRWRELKDTAGNLVRKHGQRASPLHLPDLPASILSRKPRKLGWRDFSKS